MLKINHKIPDFELGVFQNDEIKKVKLSDYQGKWLILLFYHADFTFVCPTELVEANNYYNDFQKLNAEILSISTDPVLIHKRWHDFASEIKEIKFPMGSDPTGEICEVFGTYIPDEKVSLRATFIVDPDGILKSYEIGDYHVGRNIREVLRKLQAFIYVRKHEDELCPASWEPGKKTIKIPLELKQKEVLGTKIKFKDERRNRSR